MSHAGQMLQPGAARRWASFLGFGVATLVGGVLMTAAWLALIAGNMLVTLVFAFPAALLLVAARRGLVRRLRARDRVEADASADGGEEAVDAHDYSGLPSVAPPGYRVPVPGAFRALVIGLGVALMVPLGLLGAAFAFAGGCLGEPALILVGLGLMTLGSVLPAAAYVWVGR